MRGSESGLTSGEAQRRLSEYGANRIVPEKRRLPLIGWLLHPFTDPMVVLLVVAGIAYLFLRDFVDAVIVLVALVPIALVSTVLEVRAERTLGRLSQLTAPTAVVWRDGRRVTIPTVEIVPGDLVVLQEGDVVAADGLLVEGTQIAVDESPLTGESQPVEKDSSASGARREVYAGTTILSGRGLLRVTVTGRRTRYGQIGILIARIRQPPTPLQRLISRLVWQATFVAAGFCVAVAAVELAYGHGWIAAVTAGISLAIAALPEEFSIVYTLYLALGAWRLARAHAMVRNLASVETLGATTVICTDKTGTLTMGRMDVATIATPEGIFPASEPLNPRTREVLEAAVLASEPDPFDPLDRAIVRYATNCGVDVAALHRQVMVRDYPFDRILKYVSHVWQSGDRVQICAKGALEGILERSHASPEVRQQAVEANRSLATEGLRVVAVAGGDLPASHGDRLADECHLWFLGLVAFSDPPRPGVAEALADCCRAGIRVIMITGDHPVTAHAIAEGLGLPHSDHIATGDELDGCDTAAWVRLVEEVNIFARIRPEQKYRLVQTLRTQGQVVAMTGDGINDAPALREADVGVAMGQRGTEVAREAADLVLLDDNFATIVSAIHDGRRIFENLRRAFSYLIAFETPLLLVALVIPLVGAPLLLLPASLILSEIVVHPTASLVFENDPPPPDLMRRPPRAPGASLLVGRDFMRSVAVGVSLGVGVLVLYLAALSRGTPELEARGTTYAALFLGQTIMVLTERSPAQPLWKTGVQGSRVLPVILAASLLLLLIVLYVPALAGIFKLASPSAGEWATAVITAGATALWLEPLKGWQREPERSR
ncbi:MAG TPA: cation-transporting P-type ATPase [Chloroflexota bacterium]|nr:cation-transporting P-type ATPase [Chloroflexota bacterium]